MTTYTDLKAMLDDLRVDFMPDDPSILGFSNRWYPNAIKTATRYQLTPDLFIQLVRLVVIKGAKSLFLSAWRPW